MVPLLGVIREFRDITLFEIDGMMAFYREYFADSKQMHNFATQEPAKPLNNAQMCGSFFYIYYMALTIPFKAGWTKSRMVLL